MVKDLEEARHVYLVRHGTPVFPGEGRYCIGITDIPLSREGKLQGRRAGAYLRAQGVRQCYTSPLRRALDTARAMEIPLRIHQDLREQHAGIWEGLHFEEIKKSWPELYARRGDDPTLPPPGGEPLEECARRFEGALNEILGKTQESVAVVAHLTVIRAFLCGIQQIPMENIRTLSVPYGSVTRLCWEKGSWKVEEIGSMPI